MEPEIYFFFQPALDELKAEDINALVVETKEEPYVIGFHALVSPESYDFVIKRIKTVLAPYAYKAVEAKPGTAPFTFATAFWPRKDGPVSYPRPDITLLP